MMSMLWVVLFVALTGSHCGYGLPVRPTPQDYPHDGRTVFEGWGEGGLYAAIPALALVVTAIVLIFGCTWCYRHKDCKPDEGTDNQLFTASAQHLHTARVHPPDSGFSEPANNNISEDNNNGPISLREMQNIANNNAAAYIISENEERNRISRESVVEFEPLPTAIIGADPLEHCADWFGDEDFPRNNLQYLREIGRGWFGRVVEGEIEEAGANTTVAVKILNQNASLEDKARFLDESKMYRDVRHEHILAFIGRCLGEDPWILIFELCNMDLQQYLVVNRPKMAILNENGVPLRIMCDVTSALAYLHSRGYTYGQLWGGSVLVRGEGAAARGVLGRYAAAGAPQDSAPELQRPGAVYSTNSEIWSLGTLLWEVCSWGSVPTGRPSPPPDLPCPHKSHLYRVMQLCWQAEPRARPSAAQAHALVSHLHVTHAQARARARGAGAGAADFEERWRRLEPNTVPRVDEHVAIVHAPCAPAGSQFAGPEEPDGALGADADAAVSRSSSIMSDRDPLSTPMKSESLTNLHGSLEDVRNVYLTHDETAALECHQGNVRLDDAAEREDRSDSSVDPWLRDIVAGSQDDVSYYRDVSDVIKNLDNILNSEKTSSSESSHQASPSRDNLSLDCKKEYPLQSTLVKSPGITNFQNILDTGFAANPEGGEPCVDDEVDRDTIGTLSHSFERHSDSTSQHTLENLTPDTPMKDLDVLVDIEAQMFDTDVVIENEMNDTKAVALESEVKDLEEVAEVDRLDTIVDVADVEFETDEPYETKFERDTQLPKEVVDSNIPKLKELCVASMPSVSEYNNEQSLVRKDCQTPCDNVEEIRTDNEETKSIGDVRDVISDSMPLEETEATISVDNHEQMETTSVQETFLPISADETTTSNEGVDTLPSVTDDESNTTQENDTSHIKLEDIGPESIESENNYSKDETILVSDLVDTVTDSSKDEQVEHRDGVVKVDIEVDLEPITPEQTPVSVQSIIDNMKEPADFKEIEIADSEFVEQDVEIMPTHLPPEIVQNMEKPAPIHETLNLVCKEVIEAKNENIDNKDSETENMPRSDSYVVNNIEEQSDDSTVYKDLINNTNSQIINDSTLGNSVNEVEVKETKSGLETISAIDDGALSRNESTEYLDLPSFEVIKNFLHMERMISSKHLDKKLFASTPIASDNSIETLDNTAENSVKENETKVPENGPGPSVTKLEQKHPPDSMSPFESPSHKSHHTDTYDENSSVVLGPFENCTMELFKTAKCNIDPVELPREELLAFSSNFSEMNLETPSPLRDGNFLNEVPDIIPDDAQFEDLASVSEPKVEFEVPSDDTEDSGSGTQKRVSPSTPPNSPGIFLASTSQQKYLVDIDLNGESAPEPDSSLRSLDLNQIELQITSKLAMAENENNLNIEYSGPLTVEGLIEEGGGMRESDAIPESYLAGNGSLEDVREELSLDEECVKALRNELELKLPLAQVAAIEPQCEGDGEWQVELPPPPELVVSYPGALSPIQEETGQQLSAYENDTNWNPSTRTDSSESYPEPCNNSTDSATELPRRDTAPASRDATYTLHRAAPPHTSRELTMSADSSNASPLKSQNEPDEVVAAIDDRTYNKDDERESHCERISQVSPFLVSPTTDTSDGDNATRVSTLSKTTLPTDAKLSKPSETQCLSKATSIDSWCSNDTLYNVEENFDDLAMDSDLPLEYEPPKRDGNSASTDTLTRNDDEKEHSHCSTYIIHDSESEHCETFSPDSITANDNYTYTKVKTEAVATTPSGDTELNDSTKNTQTKDLAYGTLLSGVPSCSNCTTELASARDASWRLPELVRRSPVPGDVSFSPLKTTEVKECLEDSSPQLASEPRIGRMDSVEISCLQDDSDHNSENKDLIVIDDSPNYNYRNMIPSVTSTPLFELAADEENTDAIPMSLPETTMESASNFRAFQQSADMRPQDLSINATDENAQNQESILLEGYSKTLSRNSNRDSLIVSERTPTFSDFESSVEFRPQNSKDRSIQSVESGISSEDFRQFENSVKSRPQDLSSAIDASSQLLKSERMSGELAISSFTGLYDQTSQSNSKSNEPMQSLDVSPPNITNLIESHELVDTREPSSTFLINFDIEDETEQPHSIIVTEIPMSSTRISSNRAYDLPIESSLIDFIQTQDSHESSKVSDERNQHTDQPKMNGEIYNEQPESLMVIEQKSPIIEDRSIANHILTTEVAEDEIEIIQSNDNPLSESQKDLTNGSIDLPKSEPVQKIRKEVQLNGGSEKYATVNFLNETFEELIESSVDDGDSKDDKLVIDEPSPAEDTTADIASDLEEKITSPVEEKSLEKSKENLPRSSTDSEDQIMANGVTEAESRITAVTEDFLQNEKKYATLDSYFPLLSDIRFTGPASEMMSTSFQDSPSSPTSPDCEQDSKPNTAADILKEWDSDSDSHSSNSSSGEFIWKDGDGHETSVVPSTHFDHQRGSGGPASGDSDGRRGPGSGASGASEGSADSGSGSEGDEVEFVPSSWDCRAAPAKSSLRSLEATPESKKRVVFKRQKYHCVYEYPREAAGAPHDPAYLPDLSTYCEWDPTSAEEAELCYGQLFASPAGLGAAYPLRAGIAFGADYDEDFFISSSARPFESLGVMSTTSQFFPGMHAKRELPDADEFPPPASAPAPAPAAAPAPPPPPPPHSRTPSLDFTTPDSGVEDITPGSTTDEHFEPHGGPLEPAWRPADSSSESASPGSPGGGEALGGLRHTRDRLKLDLSPRHARVFSFVLAAPKRRPEEPPLVMSDDTPPAAPALPPVEAGAPPPPPEPTFSTFGKGAPRSEPERKIVLDEVADADEASPRATEGVKGEGTVLDSGDEDSGIESSAKATLERKAPNVS